MTGNGDELRVRAAEILAAEPFGARAEHDWAVVEKTGSALFDRFQQLGRRGDPLDLEQSHQLACLGYRYATGSFRQQFATLLVSVALVRGRYDSDPRRRATVADMARHLCRTCLEAGDQPSLQRVAEVAMLWERCATIAGASAEAAEARAVAAKAGLPG
jgi:hypothetical protein